MPWPTPQDYNEALQNPQLSFSDPELQGGRPELSPLGLPRPITGNFASVYRITCGSKDWAVRCFWRDYGDMRDRYAAISRHLESSKLAHTVGFEYLAQGIRISGKWYPILKMEWVEGPLLSEYVESNLQNQNALRELSRKWLEMLAALERAGIAHGDLQHGNVLVHNGVLKLVDYDGMYVPGLGGRGSHELGHQNYQHPQRTGQDFGPHIDRFSAWVIYLSLAALAEDSSLWTRATGGDECLLLRKTDFEAPERSEMLRLLESQNDAVIRAMTSRFRGLLQSPLTSIPSPAAPSTPPEAPSTGWVQKLVPSRGAQRSGTLYALATSPAAGGPPPWIADLVLNSESGPVRSFGSVSWIARAVAAGPLGLTGCILLAAWTLHASALEAACLSLAAICVALAELQWTYRLDPATRLAVKVARRERAARRQLNAIRRHVASLQRAVRRAEASHLHRLERQRGTARRRADRHTQKRDRLDQAYRDATADLDEWKRYVDKLETDEVSGRLRHLRASHVEAVLRQRKLLREPIAGLGVMSKARLYLAGIRSAADVRSGKVAPLDALGGSRAASVLAWRLSVEEDARATIPHKLEPGLRDAIKQRYDRARDRIARLRVLLEAEFASACDVLEELADWDRAAAAESGIREEERHVAALQDLQTAISAARQNEPAQAFEVVRAERDREPFSRITFLHWIVHVLVPGNLAAPWS